MGCLFAKCVLGDSVHSALESFLLRIYHSLPPLLYELQIVSVMSLYFFQVTDKVWYSIATECFVCLETKFSTDESQFILSARFLFI